MACECSNVCDIFFKIFLFILIIGPVLAVTVLLIAMALVANAFTLLYFILLGWFCEFGICRCHDKFIIDCLKKPWNPLFIFVEKVFNFFTTPLIGSDNYNRETIVHNNSNYSSNNSNY